MISVIIPTYKNADTIVDALDSIVNQTYQDLEVIVVDDQSPDNTEGVVRDSFAGDSRVKYFKNDYPVTKKFNKHGTNIDAGFSARNFGLEQVKGDWITFQDGDDISFLNRLDVQLGLAEEYNVCHLTTTCVWLKDEYKGMLLDFEKFCLDFPVEETVKSSELLSAMAEESQGPIARIMPEFVFSKIPFRFKSHRVFQKLFFANEKSWPGTAGIAFIHKKVVQSIQFRTLNARRWPSLRGRGTDRDFSFNVASTFGNSMSFDIPLYCWRTKTEFEDRFNISEYLYR